MVVLMSGRSLSEAPCFQPYFRSLTVQHGAWDRSLEGHAHLRLRLWELDLGPGTVSNELRCTETVRGAVGTVDGECVRRIRYLSDELREWNRVRPSPTLSRATAKPHRRSYLSYFNLDGQSSGGGVGTTTALVFGMASALFLTVRALRRLAKPYDSSKYRNMPHRPSRGSSFGSSWATRSDGEFFWGGLLCLIGAIVVTIAKDVNYLKGGRFLLGMSTALLQVAAPMYVAELSPPQWRGPLTGMYGATAILATIISGVVTTVAARWNNTASWRLPLSIQIIPSAILCLTVVFIPEVKDTKHRIDPYLIMPSHHVGSCQLGAATKPSKSSLDIRPMGIQQNPTCFYKFKIWIARSMAMSADPLALFKTRSDRYRVFLVVLLALSSQWTGSGLSYFLVVLLAQDHISTQNLRLVLSLVSGIVSAAGATVGALVSDRVGRVSLWFWGTVSCTVCLAISGARWVYSADNPAGSHTAIAFFMLFNFFYCATYVSLPPAYTSECMSFHNRANGVAFETLVASAASAVVTFATPIALAKISWRLYFVFIGWDVVACVLIRLFAVETSRKTLSRAKRERVINQDRGSETQDAFRKQVFDEGIIKEGDTIGTDDETLFFRRRFLRARNFNIAHSKTMLANAQNWRKTVEGVGIDALYEETDPFDYPEREIVFDCWPLWFHKTDKVRLECLSRVIRIPISAATLPGLYKHVTPSRHWRTLLSNAECLTREILPACSRQAGTHVGTVLVIVDLQGFGLSKFWGMKSLVRTAFQISQDYFPETMGQLAIVNAPSSFTMIWSMMRPWLSKETAEKVDILGHDYQNVLNALIDPENLPTTLGGKCLCPEGCHQSSAGPWLEGRVGWGPQAQAVAAERDQSNLEASSAADDPSCSDDKDSSPAPSVVPEQSTSAQ
ncbi:unnamed protein product [Mycena citricolor]|uniref:Major facilitator superfamily (MFS) profile domain-containing protein n=1 Tax=Mycena citricolor TaxID=2018698 RepID=A0AAD2HA75_9AGAR|nr:unnamed protein product [Mycena citricolor]